MDTNINYDYYPAGYINLLRTAIHSQTQIGWFNLMKGYLSTKWHELASTDFSFPEDEPTNRDDGSHRISKARHSGNSHLHTYACFGLHETTLYTVTRRTTLVTRGLYWMLKLRNITQIQRPFFQLPINTTATFDSTLYYANPDPTNGAGSFVSVALEKCSRL